MASAEALRAAFWSLGPTISAITSGARLSLRAIKFPQYLSFKCKLRFGHCIATVLLAMSIGIDLQVLRKKENSYDCAADVENASVVPRDIDENNVKYLIFVLMFGFYLFILCASIANKTGAMLGDPDVYWHVAVGRDIWRVGAFPIFDQYSHTFRGHPWIAKEWLSQLILFAAYSLGGWRGVSLLAAGVVALTYGLLFLAMARSVRLAVAVGVATLAWAFSTGHFIARPQIFADPLIVIWIASLTNAVDRRSPPKFLLAPVMTLWANLHGSFTIGLAIAAALAADAVFRAPEGERARTARRWAIFLLAALACAGITPYGYQPLLMTFHVFVGNEALQYVWEWRPRTLEGFGVIELTLFGLLFLALCHGVKLPPARLLLSIALLYLMLAHLRFAALFAISAPLLLATPLAEQFAFFRPRTLAGGANQTLAKASRRFLYPVAGLIFLGASTFLAYGPNAAPKADITPTGAVDFLIRERLADKIYNDYNFGGYLIFRGVPTFVDGRSDQLFVGGFLTKLHAIIDRRPSDFPAYLRNYEISVALVAPDGPEAQALARSPDWERLYSDGVSAVFRERMP